MNDPLDRSKNKWIKDYFICYDCATNKGGVSGNVETEAKIGECKYCNEKGVVLTPLYSYDWPNDKVLDDHAKRHRG